MGLTVLLGLLGLGAGWALWDAFDGNGSAEDETALDTSDPESIEEWVDTYRAGEGAGGAEVRHIRDTATEGNDILESDATRHDAPVEGGGGDDLFLLQRNLSSGDPVLTGGEGSDFFLSDDSYRAGRDEVFEITDFDPEEDLLAVSPPAGLSWQPSGVTATPSEDGSFTDVIVSYEFEAKTFSTIFRLQGVSEFDPDDVIFTRGTFWEATDDGWVLGVHEPLDLVHAPGGDVTIEDASWLVGSAGDDNVTLIDQSAGVIKTAGGNDSVIGTADNMIINTGDGDDVIDVTAPDQILSGHGADQITLHVTADSVAAGTTTEIDYFSEEDSLTIELDKDVEGQVYVQLEWTSESGEDWYHREHRIVYYLGQGDAHDPETDQRFLVMDLGSYSVLDGATPDIRDGYNEDPDITVNREVTQLPTSWVPPWAY